MTERTYKKDLEIVTVVSATTCSSDGFICYMLCVACTFLFGCLYCRTTFVFNVVRMYIAQLFREATDQLDSFPSQISDVLFDGLGAIYKLHCALLKEIEQRLTVW